MDVAHIALSHVLYACIHGILQQHAKLIQSTMSCDLHTTHNQPISSGFSTEMTAKYFTVNLFVFEKHMIHQQSNSSGISVPRGILHSNHSKIITNSKKSDTEELYLLFEKNDICFFQAIYCYFNVLHTVQ